MREVIYRRYFRVLKDKLVKPDLIIVDGGVGQINVALEVLESLCLDIPIVGLKKDDNHRTNALVASKPIREIPLDKTSNLFHLLTRMQEEVHNYTINYHKKNPFYLFLSSRRILTAGAGICAYIISTTAVYSSAI